MQTHAWMRARVGSLEGVRDLHLHAVRDDAGIQALAPLLRIGDWFRELPALFEPSDLVWSTPEALRELAAMLAEQPLPVNLQRVPVGSPTIPALRKAYAGRGAVLVQPAMPTPVIKLDAASHDVDSLFNARRKSDFRRAERRAVVRGEVTYELHCPADKADLAPLMDTVHVVAARSWKEANGTSLTADRWQGDFFMRFASEAAESGVLRIAFMRIARQPVAMQIATEWGGRFWLFKISHDQDFSPCSPGQLLLLHTLRYAAGKGLSSYEFMGVMADWTRLWTRDSRRYAQVRAVPFNATMGKLLVRRGARAMLGSLRRAVR
jgi:CelD/BcsL family acetyltransferase involved in cellulose biosynthesis